MPVGRCSLCSSLNQKSRVSVNLQSSVQDQHSSSSLRMVGRVEGCLRQLTSLETQLNEFRRHFENTERIFTNNIHALRGQINEMCMGTVCDLLLRALREAEANEASIENKGQLREICQFVQEPHSIPRMTAYIKLHKMHKDRQCKQCKPKQPCPMGRSLTVVKDLLILTVCSSGGPWDNTKLGIILREVVMISDNRDYLNKIELSQLLLAFNKIQEHGSKREGFGEWVCSLGMYGTDLTTDEVDELFQVYSRCSHSSPEYVSKNKASGKHKRRKKKEPVTQEAATDESEQQDIAPVNVSVAEPVSVSLAPSQGDTSHSAVQSLPAKVSVAEPVSLPPSQGHFDWAAMRHEIYSGMLLDQSEAWEFPVPPPPGLRALPSGGQVFF